MVRIRIGLPQMSISNITTNSEGKAVLTIAGYEFTFSYVEPVFFPRRPDGTTRHWPELFTVPTVEQLCIGDTILPYEPRPSDSVQVVGWRNRIQIVRNIYHWGSGDSVVIQTITPNVPVSADNARPRMYKYKYTLGEKVDNFEWHLFVARERVPVSDYEKAGPYEYEVFSSDGRVAEIWLWIHKTGRGRWPKEMVDFEFPETPGTYEMRPPTNRSDWKKLHLKENGKRHPSDLTREGVALKYSKWKKTTRHEGQKDAFVVDEMREHPRHG